MAAARKTLIAALLLALVVAQVAGAYDYPLDSTSIREAYFLGQRYDEKAAKFLAQYIQRPPLPKTGPHVAEIEIRTPFEQVVLRSRRHSLGYSAQRAEQDYAARPDRVLVRVQIRLTPSYGALLPAPPGSSGVQVRSPDFWSDFSFRVLQGSAITPKRIHGAPVYGPGFGPSSTLTGAEVLLEFNAAQFRSAPVRIEVITPDHQHVAAEFDLRDLR